jgi:hypothetical protein
MPKAILTVGIVMAVMGASVGSAGACWMIATAIE